jgi:hypothetical protein
MEKKLVFKIRVAWLSLVIFLVTFLAIKYIVPDGKIVYQGDLLKKNYFIANLTPLDRVKEVDGRVVVAEEPVYFSLKAPRYFKEAEVELKYKFLTDDYKFLNIGFLANEKFWRYLEKPLENKLLEKLINEWDVTAADNGYIFLQKEKKYNNLEEYLNGVVKRSEVAIFNIDNKEIKLPNFEIENNGAEGKDEEKILIKKDILNIPFAIQGDQQMFIYSFGEEINLNFDFIDINENSGKDEFEIKVYYNNQVIKEEKFSDDGNILDNEKKSELKHINFFTGYLSAGAYKIEIMANNDIVISNFLSNTNNLVFINKINLAADENQNSNNGNKNIEIYTNGNFLKVVTVHPEAIQEIVVGNKNDGEESEKEKKFSIEKTYIQNYFPFVDLKNGIKKVNLETGGILLANNDLFFVAGANFFDPRIKTINFLAEEDLEEINYIIAKYEPVKRKDDWTISKANFSLDQVWQEENKYNILLSIQGINQKKDEDILEIDNIKVTFKGTSLWKKIKQIIF